MTGPVRFREAERLVEHAAWMLDSDVAPEDPAELGQRRGVVATMATVHALLALAAATGLSAHLDTLDTQARHDVAVTGSIRPMPGPPLRARRRPDRGWGISCGSMSLWPMAAGYTMG